MGDAIKPVDRSTNGQPVVASVDGWNVGTQVMEGRRLVNRARGRLTGGSWLSSILEIGKCTFD